MTRLIEALKKAEEAKRKQETPRKSQDLSLELEEPGHKPDDNQDALGPSPEIPEAGSGLALEPEPSDTAEPQATEPDSNAAENNVFEPTPAYQTETEPQSTAEFDITPDDSTSEASRRRLTDKSNPRLRPVSPIAKSKKRMSIFALAALLLFGGVFAFLYWQLNSQSDPYANLTPEAQNRGFLDSSSNQESPEASSAEGAEADTSSQTQSLQTQTTIGPSVSEPIENPNQPAVDETITAVNALIANPGQTSPEPPPVMTAQRTTVFNIEPVQRVPGSEDAFAFARANMQQGEWEAAKSELEALLRAQPTSLRALEYLAQVHTEMGNFPQAERAYAKILQLAPQNSVAQAGLIRASQSDSLGYEATLLALQNNYRDQAFIPFMLGNHFAGQRRWNEATGSYQQAVSLAESFGEIPAQYLYNLAISLEHLHRPGEALAQYQRAETLLAQGSNNIDLALLQTRIERLETSLQQ